MEVEKLEALINTIKKIDKLKEHIELNNKKDAQIRYKSNAFFTRQDARNSFCVESIRLCLEVNDDAINNDMIKDFINCNIIKFLNQRSVEFLDFVRSDMREVAIANKDSVQKELVRSLSLIQSV